ncbi:MAG TPA: response regulator [Bryobacteraceae bacterium]
MPFRLKTIRRWFENPNWAARYAIAFLSLAALTGATVLLVRLLGRQHPFLFALVLAGYFLVLMGSAWLGYGPGAMICFLSAFGLPLLFPPQRASFQAESLRFGVLLLISLVVSRISQTRRQREADLRRTAETLEERVRERTEEAYRALAAAREAEDSLREQAQLLDLAHDAILAMDWDGKIHFWSCGAEQMYGFSKDEALGTISHDLLKTVFPVLLQEVKTQLEAQGHWEGELVHTRRDGVQLRVASRWAVHRGDDGSPRGFLEINTDVTERRRIEEQLRHTQKLESLGVLAGGVAHDFNNLLTGILKNASLVLDNVPPHHANRKMLEDLMKATKRAADLTRQLLAYAGKGRFVLRTVDLSGLVREISGLIQTSIPKHVQIRLQLADDLPGTEADSGQLQQIVMNLVINGAEAIGPEGGTVLVRTAAQTIDQPYIATMSSAGELLQPGKYVSLEVHDTGSGMDEETLARIFDPFFTTKFAGRGLGLSAVLGIVRSHRGALKVYSKPGQGSTFKVLLPACAHRISEDPAETSGDLAGSGTILVVDDEEIVRQTAKHTLERYGYAVVTAEDGGAAVETYRRLPSGIQAVLLDLTMPGMSGEETLRQLQTIDPKVRVVLTSGYNEVEAVQRFAGKGLAGFIQKPYTARLLAERVKEAVERDSALRGGGGR